MFFVIISIVIFNSIAFFMTKRISRVEMYASSLFVLFLEYLANYVFDFIHKLYGYFNPGIDNLTFIVVVGIYPAVNIIFVNYFPYKGRALSKLIFILATSIFCTFYEWLSIKSKYFYHSGWPLWLSFISYLILFEIIVFNLKLIRKLNKGES
jgi:hypothetical protein